MSVRPYGPSALGGDLSRLAGLTWMLAVTEFKLRFFGSVLGYLWSLLRPLMLFGILYAVFTQVFDLGGEVRFYPVYLLGAVVLFAYFSEVTGNCVSSLVNRENILRKIRFPRAVIPLSVALTALFNLGLNLVVVLIFALGSGVVPRWSWLEMLPLILALIAIATGAGMLLSALFVRFRDVSPIWDVVLQALFYATPILYPAAKLPNSVERIAMCNPLAVVVTEMRHALLDPAAPTAAAAIGGSVRLLIPLAIVAAVLALGMWFFNREAPRIAENL